MLKKMMKYEIGQKINAKRKKVCFVKTNFAKIRNS